jgi:hypothetical protein
MEKEMKRFSLRVSLLSLFAAMVFYATYKGNETEAEIALTSKGIKLSS